MRVSRVFLSAKGRTNLQGDFPLRLACTRNHRDAVSLLLDRGADADSGLHKALYCEHFEIADLLIGRGANPVKLGSHKQSLVIDLLAFNKLRGAAYLVGKYRDRLPAIDVRAFHEVLSPVQETVPNDFALPSWLREIPSPLTPPSSGETIDLTAIGNALRALRRDASIHDILPILRRDPRFERAWLRAGCTTLEEVGDAAFVDAEGKSIFPSGTGAHCYPSLNKIQIHRNESLPRKIHSLIFETMNLVQKENFRIVDNRMDSGQLGREERTLLDERIEHNSETWSGEIYRSLGFTELPPRTFSQAWEMVQRTSPASSLSHADSYRTAWDRTAAKTFLATDTGRGAVQKRADEIRVGGTGVAQTSFCKRAPHG